MGFLLPWSQINSWAYYKYPIYRHEKLRNIFREYSNLRMQLLPYIYTQAWKGSSTAMPMMRPMFLDYPDWEDSYKIITQYIFGDSFLVNSFSPNIILPEGKWFDLWTNTVYEGTGTEMSIDIPSDRGGHLFLKEGGIVPMGPLAQYVDEAALTEIHWLVYPADKSTKGDVYLDDGYSFEYRNGDCAVITLTCKKKDDTFELSFSQTGTYHHTVKTHHVEIVGFENIEITSNQNTNPIVQGIYGQVIKNLSSTDKLYLQPS